jgi:hypothetical protein
VIDDFTADKLAVLARQSAADGVTLTTRSAMTRAGSTGSPSLTS